MLLWRRTDANISPLCILLFTEVCINDFLLNIFAWLPLRAGNCLFRPLVAFQGGQVIHDLRVNAWSLLNLRHVLNGFLKGEEIFDLSLGRIVVCSHSLIDIFELIEHSIKVLTAFFRVLKIVILLERGCLSMIWCFLGGRARLVPVSALWLKACWLVKPQILIICWVIHIWLFILKHYIGSCQDHFMFFVWWWYILSAYGICTRSGFLAIFYKLEVGLILRFREVPHHALLVWLLLHRLLIWWLLRGIVAVLLHVNNFWRGHGLLNILECSVGCTDDTQAVEPGQVLSGLPLLLQTSQIRPVQALQSSVPCLAQGLECALLHLLSQDVSGHWRSRLEDFFLRL